MKTYFDFTDRFIGFQNTPLLWNSDAIDTLVQFNIAPTQRNYNVKSNQKKMRLGKWVESFTAFQLQQIEGIEFIAENLQIITNKQTIGEIDFLLLNNEVPIHLEIAYKFYLYDYTNEYLNPLDYWIGPNRTDSLSLKLKKLIQKQLPLLYKTETKLALKELGFENQNFEQYVNFKAQLFVPLNKKKIDFNLLNKKCIAGFYLHFNNVEILKNNHFYIPNKLDWLVEPKLNVEWLSFNNAKNILRILISKQQSPLCWLKDNDNQLIKCFVTWW
ncbi:DUF1853 family protein [Winogradskyella sp. J14-2]|uniref:DUF1853 family protein n=1 Tax=Winogradskyella sp. J14-2 TaxID=1936080 RepID=UPI0009FADAE3|nr:DUF1853 family protein [Winogradskyella sp. J14-2]